MKIRKTYEIEAKILTNIKQQSIVIISFMVFCFTSACTYEPKTIVKMPRTWTADPVLKIKKNNSIKDTSNNPLSDNIAFNKKEIGPLPIIGVDLSNFKENLIGLNKVEIIELLDKPNFKRTEYPASIWQYQSSVCFVDIFFYSDNKTLIVDHVEIRSTNIKKIADKICFSSFLDSNFYKKTKS